MPGNADKNTDKLQGQLFQAQKMEAIASLTGGIAHDFNNLLTVINGHAEIALIKLERDTPPDKLRKDLQAILDAGKRAQKLTQQLLAFSRKQVIEPRIMDLNQAITNMEKMLRPLIGEDIIMEIRLSRDLPCINADPSQIEQVIMNLVLNARDAILEKLKLNPLSEKRILIDTRRVDLDETFVIQHPGSHTGLHASLVVTDTGIGMDSHIIAKIFEPFFTTKPKDKGTGLGMSTVYGIVKQNNGSIYAYSEPGEGAVFRVYWPATFATQPTEITTPPPPGNLTGNETILLVEDEKAVRNFAYHTLVELGYTVFDAANGKKALKLLKRKRIHVDLLLTDMIMPEMNGRELASHLREISPTTLVLYTSGYTDSYIIRRNELESDMHFINKPYSVNDLAQKVREILDTKK